MKKNVLVIMAHQDDEVAFSTRIARDIAQGHSITCVYLTDGAGGNVAPLIRDKESLRVLNRLGVEKDDIHFIGSKHRLPDGSLAEHLDRAYEILENTLADKRFHRVYSMAYEGGHHDHDACYLASMAYVTKRNLLPRTWQIPLYNGFGTKHKFFRVLSPVPSPTRKLERKLGIKEAFNHTLCVRHYKSQWKTWLGLLPELIYQRLLMRREILLASHISVVKDRPHEGPLLYERLFGFSYQRFNSSIDEFLKKHL